MPATFTIKALTHEWESRTEAGKITGRCVWQVQASEPVTPFQAERAGSPITAIGVTMPGTSAGVPCISREARAVDQTRQLYRVTCSYDSTITLTEDPLGQPMRVTYDPTSREVPYFKDETSPTPLLAQTTAGEPFPTLPTRDEGALAITIERNVAHTTNYTAYEAFLKPKVNNGNVTIDGRTYAAGTLRSTSPRLSEIKEQNGTQYRTLTVTLLANPDGWDQVYESRGLWELDDGEYRRIAAPDGAPVETPWPLNSDGTKKAASTDTGADVTLKPYAAASFSALVA